MKKYLSIITQFGCHYTCPCCIVKNNNIDIKPTTIESLDLVEKQLKKDLKILRKKRWKIMKYKIKVIEILEKTFEIEADSKEEALSIVESNYALAIEEYVLDAENHTSTSFELESDEE